jgi:hypothetical protein
MMSAPAAIPLHNIDAAIEDKPSLSRVRLRAGPSSDHVDGAWWPRSRDLAAELPAFLKAIIHSVGAVAEIGYHPADWIGAPWDRATNTPITRTELGELRGTVRVRGSRGSRTILIVPSGTSELEAGDVLSEVLTDSHHVNVQEHLRPVPDLVSDTEPEGGRR